MKKIHFQKNIYQLLLKFSRSIIPDEQCRLDIVNNTMINLQGKKVKDLDNYLRRSLRINYIDYKRRNARRLGVYIEDAKLAENTKDKLAVIFKAGETQTATTQNNLVMDKLVHYAETHLAPVQRKILYTLIQSDGDTLRSEADSIKMNRDTYKANYRNLILKHGKQIREIITS